MQPACLMILGMLSLRRQQVRLVGARQADGRMSGMDAGRASRRATRSRLCVGSVSRDVQITLKPSTPTLSMTAGRTPHRRCIAGSSPPARAVGAAAGRADCRRGAGAHRNAPRSSAGSGSRPSDTAFITYSAWPSTDGHERGDPIQDRPLLGRGDHRQQPGAVTLPPDDLRQFAEPGAAVAREVRSDRSPPWR